MNLLGSDDSEINIAPEPDFSICWMSLRSSEEPLPPKPINVIFPQQM
jgi:hypothetical protein